ncbi:hypothetical protein NKL07_33255 [Mesorhizobium sp. C280B]|uniref:hypothetical protein n=1 Tax=unclassified Mesorhizobium TaxID=325217 RepID=UPI0012ECA686|nr:hypothetical protein [Mesorhizobium sp. LSJC280B00]
MDAADLNVSLAVRRVLITGSTTGMGQDIARTFARSSAKVGIHGLGNQETITNFVNELSELSDHKSFHFDTICQTAGKEAPSSRPPSRDLAISQYPH